MSPTRSLEIGSATPALNQACWLLAYLALYLLLLTASELVATEVLPTPAGYVTDAARVLELAGVERLGIELRDFEKATGVRLLVETMTFVTGNSSTSLKAQAIAESSLRGTAGAVLCYNRADTDVPSIEFSPAMLTQWPALELSRVKELAASAMLAHSVPRERLLAGAKALVSAFTASHQARRSTAAGKTKGETLVGLGVVALMLLGVSVLWRSKRSDRVSGADDLTTFSLPEVEVAQRFGASCGGGVSVEVSANL